nr:MAG: capsid protein [Wufeng shrew dicistrovirus 12]
MCQTTSPSSNANLSTLTGMPRVNLDLMDATRADLTVPYASPFIYYNLLNGEGTIGDFYITVYSQLKDVAADATVSVQVMARFVDVDLQFPAGTDPVSFSKVPTLDGLINKFTQKPNLVALQNLIREGQALAQQHREGNFRFQMNSENVTTSNFKPKALPNMAVSNESNNAHIMSLSSTNVLPSANMGKASSNEMDFKTIVQIPVYFDRFNISSATGGGTNAYSKIVTLLDYTNVDATTGSVGIDYPTFLGQNFSKWRSSFKYNFRFVKTTFHSLRVRIFFAPNATSESGVDRNAVISKIIDLKDNNFVEFEVPFIWPHPFLNTEVGNKNLGILGVDILTKMVHPATVASSIDVIVERAAGTDFCLNLPKQISYFPFDPTPEETRRAPQASHHISRRIGASEPVRNAEPNDTFEYSVKPDPVVVPKQSEFLPPITAPFVNALTNIDSNVRKYVLQNANHFYSKAQNLTRLNELGKYTKIDYSMLDLDLAAINNKINYLSVRDLRRKREIDPNAIDVDVVGGWERDLTEEGVEPNPGPVTNGSDAVTVGTPLSFSSGIPVGSYIQNISLTIFSTGASTLTLSWGDIQMRVRLLDAGSNTINLIINQPSTVADYTFTAFTTDCTFNINTSYSSGPFPVTIAADSGVDNIVATRSDQPSAVFRFEMNREQDDYRPGYDDTSYVRPVSSNQADLLSLGSQISSVGNMIHRSSLLTSLTPTNTNDVYIIPHSVGVVRKDDANNNIVAAADMYSYYASLYAFARGGINLRLVSSPDFAYNIILDPDSDTLTATETAAAGFLPTPTSSTQSLQQQVSIQQVVKPSLEGFGEVSVPFYSDTYMYYVNPVISQQPKVSASQMQLPYTTLDLRPLGQFTTFNIFRAACTDVEFSYLTGPPRVVSLV